MSRKRRLLVVALAAQFIPIVAFGAPAPAPTSPAPAPTKPAPAPTAPAPAPTLSVPAPTGVASPVAQVQTQAVVVSGPRELSLAEASALFPDFRAEKHSDNVAHLGGAIYRACVDHFEFSVVSHKKSYGFKILDKGEGANCIETQKKMRPAGKPCNLSDCVSLEKMRGAQITFNGDGEIKLLHTSDGFKLVEESFTPPLTFVSARTRATEQQAAREAKTQTRIEELRDKVTGCGGHGDLGELDEGYRALRVMRLNKWLDRKEIKTYNEMLGAAELKLIEQEVKKADSSKLYDLKSRLHSWWDRNHDLRKKHADKVASIYQDISKRTLVLGKYSAAAYDDARPIIEEAIALDHISQSRKEELEGNLSEMKLGKGDAQLTQLARAWGQALPPGIPPQQLQMMIASHPIYRNLMRNLYQDARDCSSTMISARYGAGGIENSDQYLNALTQCENQRLALAKAQPLVNRTVTKIQEIQNEAAQFANMGTMGSPFGVPGGMNTPGMSSGLPFQNPGNYMGAGGYYGASPSWAGPQTF